MGFMHPVREALDRLAEFKGSWTKLEAEYATLVKLSKAHREEFARLLLEHITEAIGAVIETRKALRPLLDETGRKVLDKALTKEIGRAVALRKLGEQHDTEIRALRDQEAALVRHLSRGGGRNNRQFDRRREGGDRPPREERSNGQSAEAAPAPKERERKKEVKPK